MRGVGQTRVALVAALIGAAGMLGACASLKPAAPTGPASRADTAFQVSGRFAVRAGEEGGSGRIEWQHTPATDDLTILSPIGQGIARIVRENGLYTLTTRDNVKESARDPDALTERVLGWRLPLAGMPFWLRGRAAPGAAKEARGGARDRLTSLEQDGWTIEYQSYHLDNDLPERMRVRRDTLDLRLVLEEWRALVPGAPGVAPVSDAKP